MLKIDSSGQPYDDNVGTLPEMVDTNTMSLMTTIDNPQTAKDKNSLRKLQNQVAANNKKAWAQNNAKRNQIKKAGAIKAEALFQKKKQQAYLYNLKNSMRIGEAIQQGSNMTEDLSGVSGYGLSADGRNPYQSRPSLDYAPIAQAQRAFGNVQDFGGAMGATMTAYMPKTMPSDPVVTSMPMESNIIGNYTTKDQFLIELWKNNSYAIEYEQKPGTGTYAKYRKIIGLKNKSYINSHIHDRGGVKEIIDSINRGWMWSGWWVDGFDYVKEAYNAIDFLKHEDDKFIKVKVPYVYGLPMYLPPYTKLDDNQRRAAVNQVWGYTNQTRHILQSFKPIIQAFAHYYKWIMGEKEREFLKIQYETLQAGTGASDAQVANAIEASKTAVVESAITTVEKGIKKLVGDPSSLAHPMISYGLIGKKKG